MKAMLEPAGKRTAILQIAVLIILGLLIYAPCASGKFIWDDHGLIKDNTAIKGWSNLPQLLRTDFGAGSGSSSVYYRPLQTIIHLAGYAVWRENPLGFHLLSILTHILAAILFYFLLLYIFHHQVFSFIASLLFLSFPVNTEAVCYISGLSDPLVTVFLLLGMIFYLRNLSITSKRHHFLALLSFVLALGAKENAVVLPGLILLYHYVFKKAISLRTFLPFLYILIGYGLIRWAVVGAAIPLDLSGSNLWSRIPVFFAGLTQYGRLLVFPAGLHMEYAYLLPSFGGFRVILGLAILILIILAFFSSRDRDPGLSFAAGWFLVAFLPVSNIYPISQALIMEHYLYLPALGFFILLAKIFCYPFKQRIARGILRLAAAGLVIVYAYLTFKQAERWQDPVTFYQQTLKYAPHSWRFYNELGLEYASSGNPTEAQTAYQEALKINPDALGIYANLIDLYHKTDNRQKLLETEGLVEQVKDKLLKDHLSSARRFQSQGDYQQAVGELKQALGLEAGNLLIAQDLASGYILAGRYRDAVNLLNKILSAKPDFALAYNNLAVAYYYLKEYDLAVHSCEQALAYGYPVDQEFIKSIALRRK